MLRGDKVHVKEEEPVEVESMKTEENDFEDEKDHVRKIKTRDTNKLCLKVKMLMNPKLKKNEVIILDDEQPITNVGSEGTQKPLNKFKAKPDEKVSKKSHKDFVNIESTAIKKKDGTKDSFSSKKTFKRKLLFEGS